MLQLEVSPIEPVRTVYLLLNGKIDLQKHKLDEPLDLETVQVCKPGQFLGVSGLDLGVSTHPTTFPIVSSH